MEKLRRLDVASGKATVGAGVTLHELHAAARISGQFYPPDPTETMAFLRERWGHIFRLILLQTPQGSTNWTWGASRTGE